MKNKIEIHYLDANNELVVDEMDTKLIVVAAAQQCSLRMVTITVSYTKYATDVQPRIDVYTFILPQRYYFALNLEDIKVRSIKCVSQTYYDDEASYNNREITKIDFSEVGFIPYSFGCYPTKDTNPKEASFVSLYARKIMLNK